MTGSPHADGDLVLTVNAKAISGWTEMRVTRGIERCPSDFEVALTERYPGQAQPAVINPGDSCTVTIGGDLVLTGYVDDYEPGYDAQGHTIRIRGRGKCQDLVDCSAEWPTGQISGASALAIAQKLASAYLNLTVTAPDPGPAIPQFNLSLGQTAYEIIERICRYAGLLAYEGADGNLVLGAVGATKAASGAEEGQNVQSAVAPRSMRERYSEYDAFLMSAEVTGDVGYGGNLIGSAKDPNVPRHRLKYIIAEAPAGGQDVAQKRATWEAARRAGRGNRVQVTVDSWRDSAGVLWTPNTLVPVNLPALKVTNETWTLGEVTYLRDGPLGTRAELTLMPPAAFMPEPILLLPVIAGVQ
ncbi:MAG TPA: hypothetical protein VFB02_13900 [Bradyrhizobium sp.]|nr:hypothetical protein [Bradyrhizobium sp.]